MGFSFHGGLQLPGLTNISLAPSHLLNFFDAIFPPWQLALTVFKQEVLSFIVLQLVHATNKLHVYSGLYAARNLSLSVSCDSSSRSISVSNWHKDALH